jgi:hypothetical protein
VSQHQCGKETGRTGTYHHGRDITGGGSGRLIVRLRLIGADAAVTAAAQHGAFILYADRCGIHDAHAFAPVNSAAQRLQMGDLVICHAQDFGDIVPQLFFTLTGRDGYLIDTQYDRSPLFTKS